MTPEYQFKTRLTEWRDSLREAHRIGTPQANGSLNRTKSDKDAYPVGQCCMGVWCEIAVEQGRLTKAYSSEREISGVQTLVGYGPADVTNSVWGDLCVAEFPWEEAEYLGFEYGTNPTLMEVFDPKLPIGDVGWIEDRTGRPIRYSAAFLNDNLKLTFDQIADCMTWTFGLEG